MSQVKNFFFLSESSRRLYRSLKCSIELRIMRSQKGIKRKVSWGISSFSCCCYFPFLFPKLLLDDLVYWIAKKWMNFIKTGDSSSLCVDSCVGNDIINLLMMIAKTYSCWCLTLFIYFRCSRNSSCRGEDGMYHDFHFSQHI